MGQADGDDTVYIANDACRHRVRTYGNIVSTCRRFANTDDYEQDTSEKKKRTRFDGFSI